MKNKKLYKSSDNRWVDGVCSGVAEYLEIDPTIVRIIWAITIFAIGTGILAYIICMIIMPRR